jgi:hypothetical protein
MKRVADLLVDTLVAAGVERIYGLAGDSLNGITDSIRPRDNIKWVPVRHEETAAFAAGAEAHLTGRLAVCAGSCGQVTCISSMDFMMPIGAAFRFSPSRRKFPAGKSAAPISRRHTQNICLPSAAIIVN